MPQSQLPPEANKVVRILFKDIGKGISDLRKALGVNPPSTASSTSHSTHKRLTGKQKPPPHLEQASQPAPAVEPPKPRRRLVGKQKG